MPQGWNFCHMCQHQGGWSFTGRHRTIATAAIVMATHRHRSRNLSVIQPSFAMGKTLDDLLGYQLVAPVIRSHWMLWIHSGKSQEFREWKHGQKSSKIVKNQDFQQNLPENESIDPSIRRYGYPPPMHPPPPGYGAYGAPPPGRQRSELGNPGWWMMAVDGLMFSRKKA